MYPYNTGSTNFACPESFSKPKNRLYYYPFGMLMPGRHNSTEAYRYGFNGMEKDDEVKGNKGNHLDFGARCYDSRLGKFFSPDRFATKMPFQSPYAFAANNPIFYIDANGDSIYHKNINGSGNVIVYLITKEEVDAFVSKNWASYLNADGWSYVITDDEDEANQWLSDNHSDKLPQNLYIRQHSGYSYDDHNGSFDIYQQVLEAEKEKGQSGRPVGNIEAKNIRDMNRTDDPLEERLVEQYSIMLNYVEDGGNLILGFCQYGVCVVPATKDGNPRSSIVDSDKLENVHDFFGIDESVNIFVNSNSTSFRKHINGVNETLTNPDRNTYTSFNWIQFNGKGAIDVGFDLTITKGGIRKTATKSSSSGKGKGNGGGSGGKSKNPRFL